MRSQVDTDFKIVFAGLRKLLEPLAPPLKILADKPDNYSLDGGYSEKYKKTIWFGGVQIRKSYVSYHLMAVYAFPELMEGMQPALKARMQGKACFNFKKVDPDLFEELARLTRKGFDRYREENWLP